MDLLAFIFCMKDDESLKDGNSHRSLSGSGLNQSGELPTYMALMATRQNQNKEEVASIVSDFDQSAQEYAKEELVKLQAFVASAGLPHAYEPLVDFGVESVGDLLNPLLVNESALRSGVGLPSADVDRMLLVQAAAIKGEPMPPAPKPVKTPSNMQNTQSASTPSPHKAANGSRDSSATAPAVAASSPPEKATVPSRKILVSGAEETKEEIRFDGTAKTDASHKETSNIPDSAASTGAFSVGDMVRWH